MTDNDSIKALEWCGCSECIAIRDLINRQKAEIERLTTLAELGNMRANDYRVMRDKAKNARAEAIKEFAERLIRKAYIQKPYGTTQIVEVYEINHLVTEMTEEKKP